MMTKVYNKHYFKQQFSVVVWFIYNPLGQVCIEDEA
jgi:hypothetical protein